MTMEHGTHFVLNQIHRRFRICARSNTARNPRRGKNVSQKLAWSMYVLLIVAGSSTVKQRILMSKSKQHYNGENNALSKFCTISLKLLPLPICVTISCTESVNIVASITTGPLKSDKHCLLKITPINVKRNNCEIIKNAKYRATTARSSLERVVAPW